MNFFVIEKSKNLQNNGLPEYENGIKKERVR